MYKYALEEERACDYQNGNTLKAFTINQRRWAQVAICDDIDGLKRYADHLCNAGVTTPMRIVNYEQDIQFKYNY
jgi:hypothetical protein